MPGDPADTTETLPTDTEPGEGSMHPVGPRTPGAPAPERQGDAGDEDEAADRAAGEAESHDRRL